MSIMSRRARWTVFRLAWVWLTLPAAVALFWGLCRVAFPGLKINQTIPVLLKREFFPHGGIWPVTGWFWILVACGLAASVYVLSHRSVPDAPRWVALVALLVVLCVPLPIAVLNNDKDHGKFYSSATVFHVPSVDEPPSSLVNLLAKSRTGRAGCDRAGVHDVASCVRVDGSFKDLRWETRTSSLAAARTAMTNAASPVQNVDVLDGSLGYLYGETAGQGRWTAVLDGTQGQAAYGVAEWDGTTNSVRVCRFTGTHKFGRAFHGTRKFSLPNLLAEKYPDLGYEEDDVWGYCQGDEPVIVVRVTKGRGYEDRRVKVPAGVLVLKGSPSGYPRMQYKPTVGPGELPGPVYPSSIVRVQKDANSWAAGRRFKDRSAFGYQRSEFKTQQNNRGEYLMRGKDGRLYYLTPLVPHASKSESLIAYGLVRADQVGSGRLNTYDIHVLADGDPAIASLPSLHAKAVAYVSGPSSPHPNFLNSGGELQEFLPSGGGQWRVYGVQNGQTVFYVDLAATGNVQPKTVVPGAPKETDEPGKPAKELTCASPAKDLPDDLLARCLGDLADELRRRAKAP